MDWTRASGRLPQHAAVINRRQHCTSPVLLSEPGSSANKLTATHLRTPFARSRWALALTKQLVPAARCREYSSEHPTAAVIPQRTKPPMKTHETAYELA